MESTEKLRQAWLRAEERHAQAARQQKELEAEVERRWREAVEAQRAYVRALEREVASAPRPSARTPDESAQWDEPGPDFERIVLDASSRDSSSRVVSQRAIERMGPKAIEPLLAMLSRETDNWRRRINVVCGVLTAFIVAAVLQLPALAGFPEGYWLMLLALPCLVAYAKPFGRHKRVAETLAHIDNVRVIAPLIDALALEDPVIVSGAAGALKRLLRRLHPDANAGVSDAHWQTLFRVAEARRDVDLAVASVLAVEQAGDERCIPLLAPMAEGKGAGAMSRDVQRAARDCLEILADQTLRGKAGRTLLRPATGPAGQEEALLRPAGEAPPGEDESLLRATTAAEPSADEE